MTITATHGRSNLVAWGRFSVTILLIIVIQGIVLSLAILPVLALWSALLSVPAGLVTRLIVYSLLAAPSYALFALTLMLVSPIVSRVTGERTPPNAEMPLAARG